MQIKKEDLVKAQEEIRDAIVRMTIRMTQRAKKEEESPQSNLMNKNIF